MVGPRKFKSSVQELDQDLDKALHQVHSLIKMDGIRKEIYSNANTKVDVVVKTKRPKESDNWSSMLSDHSGVNKPRVRKQTRHKKTEPPGLARQRPKPATSKTAAAASTDEPDSTRHAHKFSQRTLQIFLKEMRLALKQGQDVNKIIDDLEFVALNLNPKENVPAVAAEQLYDVAFYKAEAKKAKSDVELLKRNMYKLEKQMTEMEAENKEKETKIATLKSIMTKLTSHNNQVLATLDSKADLNEKLKTTEMANNKAMQQLSAEKFKNSQLELRLKTADNEIARLQKMISALKSSGGEYLDDLNQWIRKESEPEKAPNASDKTIDLALSVTDVEKSSRDEDPDSAIGDGISDSQPLFSAPVIPQPQGVPEELPEMSFRPLNVSEETSASSNWSEMLQESNMTTTDHTDCGENVAKYLNRYRNDPKFQVSLSSTSKTRGAVQKAQVGNLNDDTKMTFGTNLDSNSTVTEDQFRQGLEATLEVTDDDE